MFYTAKKTSGRRNLALRLRDFVWYNFGMTIQEIVDSEALKTAMSAYRSMCFWNMDEDFFPSNRREVILALDNLERYGDLEAYRLAGEIRQWL